MDPKKDYLPSYGWKSIISARSLVNKGLIKRVGTGNSIQAWKDPWIPAPRPRSATCRFSIYPSNFNVKNFIDDVSKTWNIPLLSATVIQEDVQIIRTIPISRFGNPDRLGWHFTKNGKYTVKSGYRVESEDLYLATSTKSYGPHITPLQAKVWKLKCPPKIRHFIWQAVSGCLPVLQRLQSRGIKCDMVCPRCGLTEETINHALFMCPPALQIWALSKIPSALEIFPLNSMYANIDYLLSIGVMNEEGRAFPWIIWFIWKYRNDKNFNNIERNPMDTIILAESEGNAWNDAQEGNQNQTISSVESTMVHYPQNHWWCQIDGSWKIGSRFSGHGWVCSRNQGEERMYGSRNMLASQSPLHTEVEALLWAMECMKELNRQEITFATDCSDVVKMIESPLEWPAFEVHLEEFRRCKEFFEQVNISLIKRETNQVADRLAKEARTYPTALMFVDSTIPQWSIS